MNVVLVIALALFGMWMIRRSVRRVPIVRQRPVNRTTGLVALVSSFVAGVAVVAVAVVVAVKRL